MKVFDPGDPLQNFISYLVPNTFSRCGCNPMEILVSELQTKYKHARQSWTAFPQCFIFQSNPAS